MATLRRHGISLLRPGLGNFAQLQLQLIPNLPEDARKARVNQEWVMVWMEPTVHRLCLHDTSDPFRPKSTLRVFTDGSFDRPSQSGSAGVVAALDFSNLLTCNYAVDPSAVAASLLRARLASGTRFASRSSMESELHGWLLALCLFPLCLSLDIGTDSESALAAHKSMGLWIQEGDLRKRIRSPCRSLLTLIDRIIRLKRQAGGSVSFRKIPAHTRGDDLDSCGNRAADAVAKLAARRAEPLFVAPTAGSDLAYGLFMVPDAAPGAGLPPAAPSWRDVVSGDPREAVRKVMAERHLAQWIASPSQSALVRSHLELPKLLRRHAADKRIDLGILLPLFAGTMRLGLSVVDVGRPLLEAVCPVCNDANEDLNHLLSCTRTVDAAVLSLPASSVLWIRQASVPERMGLFSLEDLSVVHRLAALGLSGATARELLKLDCLLFVQLCWRFRQEFAGVYRETRFVS